MANPVFGDRVQETFTTTGTGTISLNGAVTGYQAFSSVLTDGQTCYYGMTDGTSWEVGLGTYAASGDTLARTTVFASSNGGSAINWAAGTKSVWLDLPSARLGIGQILGTNTNDSASAGNIGEYISATLASGSAISLTNNIAANITSVSLSAGDWDVWGYAHFNGGATTTVSLLGASIGNVSASYSTTPGIGAQTCYPASYVGFVNGAIVIPAPLQRISIASATTIYLVGEASFATSTCSVFGFIGARRVR